MDKVNVNPRRYDGLTVIRETMIATEPPKKTMITMYQMRAVRKPESHIATEALGEARKHHKVG